MSELSDYVSDTGGEVEPAGDSTTAILAVPEEEAGTVYTDNNWLQDFEVHFFISLPFTAFFSYVSVMSVDAMVQGKFTPDFYQADIWMIVGFAIGSSLAVALGSVNRVPDQSIHRTQEILPDLMGTEEKKSHALGKLEVVRIRY